MNLEEVRAIVVMGVAGCGKTTVGEILAESLGWEFLEGDSLHPQRNVDLMSEGTPLTDDDRMPWLAAIAEWMRSRVSHGNPVVVACSALARRYRDVLRESGAEGVLFVYLEGDRETFERRIASRTGHFMKAGMLESQFRTLEPPQKDEQYIAIDVRLSPTDAVESIRSAII